MTSTTLPRPTQVQSRRDSEIVRLKRSYLKMYLGDEVPETHSKRPMQQNTQMELTPRKKFRRESASLWRESCRSAEDLYDTSLPTLEEAALLFGFSQGESV